MPWKSKAQAAWGNSPSGLKALGGPSAVSEWNSSTDFSRLPEKLQTKAKSENHRPTRIHARGVLGQRFTKKAS